MAGTAEEVSEHTVRSPAGARIFAFAPAEQARLGAFGASIAALHIAGWGLFAYYSPRYPSIAGLGALAYTFGLRHAFDADHIAAIDNTTRKFLQEGRRAMGTGFFFSLGHSTIVFSLCAGLAIAVRAVEAEIPTLSRYGGIVGASVSGVFLYAIGILNLIVLVDILRIYREMKAGAYDEDQLEETLTNRGFMGRFLGRLFRLIDKSWHMYPLGLLFGLGFDTTTEVGLLAVTAGTVAAGTSGVEVPGLAILSLPILFAAGMSLMDTADGVFMMQAYDWAFASPLRKIYYNISVTGLSVAIALLVGTVELLQVLGDRLGGEGGLFDALGKVDFQALGYVIVGLFVVTWAGSVVIWKTRRIEERWGRSLQRP